ncbi:MAG: copper amine oxidase N-terminal domain-containing protein [Paenibacillaceae bacterium]
MILFNKERTKRRLVITLAAVIATCFLSMNVVAAVDIDKLSADSERVVLDPGFVYPSSFDYKRVFMTLANELYKKSPVTAYLPTRLPNSDWHYYGLQSKLLSDGYEIYAYKTEQLPPDGSDLPSALEQELDPSVVLFKIKAEAYNAPDKSGIALYEKDNWTFIADQPAAGTIPEKEQLTRIFTDTTKFSAPIPGAEGVVSVTGSGVNRKYTAYWTFDEKVSYSFESKSSINDFKSVLYSFRPVINLLDVVDIVLLPYETQINLQVDRKEAFLPTENMFYTLSSKPIMIEDSVFLPVVDIVWLTQGHMHYVQEEHAVYLSQNGFYNELKLDIRTGVVSKKNVRIAKVPIHVVEGRTLVPIRFLTEQFGLNLDYDQASRTVSINYSKWFTNYRTFEQAITADYPFTIFSIGGPSFHYENSRIGSGGAWSYENTRPPQGYNGLKYTIYKVSIPILPGDNEIIYRDASTDRIIATFPISADLSPADIPFRYSGSPVYDTLKMDIKLKASDGEIWPSGYVETDSYADINGAIQSEGFNYESLRVTYRQADGVDSKLESFQVSEDGKFSYRFKPIQGPGTYFVTLYNPPSSIGIFDIASIVTFVVIVK